MTKKWLLAFALLGLCPVLSFGRSFGTGISIFIPESLYRFHQGSISVETSFQQSIGVGKYLSFPIGVTWDKINGLMPGYSNATSPWFVADSISPYVMAKVQVPISIAYVEVFGGGALNWNLALTPLGQNIESYFGSTSAFSGTQVQTGYGSGLGATLGYGWQAGAGFGVTLKKYKAQVGIDATYRDISSPLTLKGSAPYNASTSVVLRGISVGLNAQLTF